MLYNLHYNAWLHWTIDMLQQFAPIIRCLAHNSLPISFILQLCYVVVGSLRTIVVAYHEFHMHSKTLYRQVKLTKARNDQSMQLL